MMDSGKEMLCIAHSGLKHKSLLDSMSLDVRQGPAKHPLLHGRQSMAC